MPAEWTVDSLHEHLASLFAERDLRYEQRFAAQERAVAAALESAKEAVLKAERAAERRFESMNEFRGVLTDQASTFVTRAESEQLHHSLQDKVDLVISRLDRLEGRTSGISAGWVLIGQAVSLLGAVIATVLALSR